MLNTLTVTPELIIEVIELMSSGLSLNQVAAQIGLSKKKLNKLINENDDFNEAVELGLTKFEAYWEGIGDKGVWGGKEFKSDVWKAKMAHHFSWADRKQIDLDPTDFKQLSEEQFNLKYEKAKQELLNDPDLKDLLEYNPVKKI